MKRHWVYVTIAGYVGAIAIACSLDPPSEGRRQAMTPPRGAEVFEIELHDMFIDDGIVTRAWAVDPDAVIGEPIDESALPTAFRDHAGFDAVAVYDVFPACNWAPDVRVEMPHSQMRIDLRSFGGCTADSIRVARAVALEFADGVDPEEIRVSHRDP